MTASEIRQKTFEKNFRGYDKDEVTVFLNSLAEAWDQLMEEKRDLERKLEYSEREATRLKNVEDSLFRTLKTAEDTGAMMIEDANRAAEEILQDAQVVTEALYNDAKTKSQNLIETAEAKGQEILENLKTDVGYFTTSVENLISQREHLINNLQRLTSRIQLELSSSQGDFEKIDLTVHRDILEKLAKSDGFTLANIDSVNSEETLEKAIRQTSAEVDEKPQEEVQINSEIQDRVIEEPASEAPRNEAEEVESVRDMPEETVEADDATQKTANKKSSKDGSFFDQLD